MVKSEWQPIATAPKDGTTVWGHNGWGGFECEWNSAYQTWVSPPRNAFVTPTHWMPLPPSPGSKRGDWP